MHAVILTSPMWVNQKMLKAIFGAVYEHLTDKHALNKDRH